MVLFKLIFYRWARLMRLAHQQGIKNMKKIKVQDLELGQMAFGNPVGEYVCPEYVDGLIAYLFEEIKRIYWNNNQEEWEETGLKFGDVEYRNYYWGEDEKEAAKPNFKFKEVELRWYKHFGRSMTINVSKTPSQWVKWFQECLKEIRKQEKSVL